jgi:hypothetical protein
MGYFRGTKRWDEEADRWLGEEVLAGWRLAMNPGKAMY